MIEKVSWTEECRITEDVLLGLVDKDIDAEMLATAEESSRRHLRNLTQLIQDFESELKRGLSGEAETLRLTSQQKERIKTFNAVRKKLQRARQQAHQRLDKQARDELLEGGEAVLQKRQQKKEDDAARKTEALNQQLRDANRTMKEQLDQGNATLNGITEGGATMRQISGTLNDMDEDINTSHSLLSQFGGQVFWDRVWIGSALLVYLAVLVYVVYRRTGLAYVVGPAFNFIFQLLGLFGNGDGDGSDVTISSSSGADSNGDLHSIGNGHQMQSDEL